MAGHFKAYSRYYDLFYADKDYAGEARFVADLVARHAPHARTVLEIGCGTGRHARELSPRGFTVHGIDLSAEMLERIDEAGAPEGFTCCVGDARSYRDGRVYDAVLSLFHVMSYQADDEELLEAFMTAAAHLDPGGVFVFDAWYGPAVLAQRPERRERTVEAPDVSVTRTAVPTHRPELNRVDVDYLIAVTERLSGDVRRFRETHPMRYLFVDEVRALLARAGIDLVESCAFMTGGPLGEDTWNATFVGVKR